MKYFVGMLVKRISVADNFVKTFITVMAKPNHQRRRRIEKG